MKVSSMRSKAILLALLTFAVGSVRAEFVDSSRAADAARNVAPSLSAQDRLGTTVESVAEHSTSNNAVFYTVKMKEGGTVFMASDDEESPVIGYTTGRGDYSKIDKRSPLWALLNRGVSGRKAAREARLRANAATPSFVRTAKSSWSALTAAKAPLKAAPVLGAGVSLTDRVPPLVQSKWNQAGWNGTLDNDTRCYNYYTPVLDDDTHAVCGCVATAMAQIMRYWQYPAQAESVERTCYVSPHWEEVEVEDIKGGKRNDYVHAGETNLWTSGTPYDWANMAYVPGSTEAVRKAIGQLTSDAGISVCMCYDHGGSGALTFNCPEAFKNVFHYGAAAIWSVGAIPPPTYSQDARKAILANLDAGCPVLFGISGSGVGGHAVVCDGYRITPTLEIHLNMGWSGAADDFYLLDPFSAGDFSYLNDVVINIFPQGDANTSIISGRITDLAGRPVEGAKVTLFAASGVSAPLTNVTTSATGIYAIFVNDDGQVSYDLEAVSPDGKTVARLDDVSSHRTAVKSDKAVVNVIEGENGKPPPTPPGKPVWQANYTSESVVTTVGNSWGNDMTLVDPAIVVRTSNHEFKGLDFPRALANAESFSREDGEPADIEILKPIDLPTDRWALNFDCTFHAAGDPDTVPVTRIGDAVLVVKEGFRALFSNIVFTAGGTVVAVETNAVAAFAGTVGPRSVGLGVELADGGKIEIAGALDASRSYVVNDFRTAEKQRSKPFGFASVDYETATNCASLFVNANDEDRVGVASEAGGGVDLVWGVAPLPVSAADATLVQNGTRVNYRKLSTAIDSAGASADIVINRPCTLAGEYSIARRKLTMRAEEPGVTVTPADTNESSHTAFVVDTDGEWAISNLVLSGFRNFAENGTKDAAFISVQNGGVFRMQDGARLENIENTYEKYGAIKTWKKATIILEEGSVITGCSSYKYGGAITLASGLAELRICGGVITNCTTKGYGGGVYATSGESVFVSGPSVVWDNFHQGDSDLKPVQDNVYFMNGQPIVDGAVSGGKVGVWWNGSKVENNDLGGIVATFADGLSDEEKEASAESFLSDVNGDWYGGVVAAVSDDKTKLVWVDSGHEPGTVPEEEGTIVVDRAGKILYFKELHYAFGRLTGGVARVTLKANCELIGNQGDVAVRGDVTLDGVGHVIGRGGDYRLFVTGEGNALTLTNVTFKGETLAGGSSGNRSLLRAENGGRIVLENETVICNVKGQSEEWRTSAGVTAMKAEIVMRPGAIVRNCKNAKSEGAGGGVLVGGTNAVFRFEGGEVTGCSATTGGGVQIDNGATIFISGGGRITGNAGGNLCVADKSALVLEDAFSGKIGYTEGYEGDTNVFGRVAADCPKSAEELAPGVKKFFRDAESDITGRIATNDTVALLVWADAFVDGVYTDEDGAEYGMVDPGDPTVVTIPTAVAGLEYDGTAKTGVVEVAGCTVEGNVATNAGGYTATATLKPGFVWSDESEDPKSIGWTIAYAPVDAPVAVEGLVYNGFEQTGVVAAVDAPYALTGNTATNAGGYTATLTLTNVNYVWADDGANPRDIPWSIAKAQYKMPYRISFTNCTYVYDGTPKLIAPPSYWNEDGSPATLPTGVRSTTSYTREDGDYPDQIKVGVYNVVLSFIGSDTVNYEPISVTENAVMEIVSDEPDPPDPPPEPEYTVTTNDPSMTPLAFSAIERIAETEWKLSVTNLLKDADYALSFTADLTTPFTTGAWFRASANGPWTTNVQFSAEDLKPAYFWRAHGRTTYVTNWLNAVQLQPQP